MNRIFQNCRAWLCSLAVALMLLVGQALIADAPHRAESPGAVLAHWTFDEETVEGDTVRDSGPHGFHGTIRNQNEIVPESVPGIRGQGLRFPSGHESWIQLDSRFTLQPPFTITVWTKLGGRRNTMELLGQKGHSWKEGMRLVFSARQFCFEYSDGTENVQIRFDSHLTGLDQWVFLAVVHDGEEIVLYVDGEEVQRAIARPAKWSTRPMFLGNYVLQKDTYRFLGTLDEILILEEALSSQDIAALGRRSLQNTR